MQTTAAAFTEQSIKKFLDEWVRAEQHGDTRFLETALTEDFVGVGPLGFMLSKRDWLNRYQSGAFHYEALSLEDTKMRFYEDAAVVIGQQVQQAQRLSQEVQGRFRITLILIGQGRIKLAGVHLSPIAQARG